MLETGVDILDTAIKLCRPQMSTSMGSVHQMAQTGCIMKTQCVVGTAGSLQGLQMSMQTTVDLVLLLLDDIDAGRAVDPLRTEQLRSTLLSNDGKALSKYPMLWRQSCAFKYTLLYSTDARLVVVPLCAEQLRSNLLSTNAKALSNTFMQKREYTVHGP